MSALLIHAQAARIMADVWSDEFASQTDAQLCALAGMLSYGYRRAADQMEEAVKMEAQAAAQGHRCTLDHAAMKGSACPACKAPLAKR